jgi:hypothetical protein
VRRASWFGTWLTYCSSVYLVGFRFFPTPACGI